MEFLENIGLLFSMTIKLLALFTPPVALTAYLNATALYTPARKRKTSLRTGLGIFIVGMVLYFFGQSIFAVFGFTLDAFRIGSGALLFLTAISLMREEKAETHVPNSDDDISIVPLAIPICLGPASIGTLMVLGASANSLSQRLLGALSLFLAASIISLMLLMADPIKRLLRRTGMAILSKLTGLLLSAIAAQVVFTGIKNFLK